MVRIFSVIVLLSLVTVAVFMYTNKYTKNTPDPQAVKLFLPKEEPGSDTINANDPSKVLTVILTDSSKIYYYAGKFNKGSIIGPIDFKEIRDVIIEKKKSIGPGFIVIIKTDGKATYKNTVDMLDEMAIGDIKRYALVDLAKYEADHLGLQMNTGN